MCWAHRSTRVLSVRSLTPCGGPRANRTAAKAAVRLASARSSCTPQAVMSVALGQAGGAHVRPVLLHVSQAFLARARTERHPPAAGNVDVGRPQRVLVLLIDEDQVGGVLVFEWVRHGSPRASGTYCADAPAASLSLAAPASRSGISRSISRTGGSNTWSARGPGPQT